MDLSPAIQALNYIIPILEKYKFRWVITGGFASLVYGVERPLTDIDIDIDASKDDKKFIDFVKELEPYTTQGLNRYVDQNYDNYNVEATYKGQILDICPMAELNICNRATGAFEKLYKDGFPKIEMVDFHGFKLPLLPKQSIIRTKEMLVWQRDSDHRDIAGLRALMKA